MQPDSSDAPFSALTPDVILGAVDAFGLCTSGRFLALNSYENRVYQVGIEERAPVIAKFYRPGRWSAEAIREEHAFARELSAHDIPVIAPLPNVNGDTLLEYQGHRYALYPRRGGRWPELEDEDTLRWLGRFLGRMHAIGRARQFQFRPRLTIQRLGYDAVTAVLASPLLAPELRANYQAAAHDLLDAVGQVWDAVGGIPAIRLHGDFHPGNILWTQDGPHVVDLDDTQTGPPIQDLWLLLCGQRQDMSRQLSILLEEYTRFCDFDLAQVRLIEALRALRMLHHAGWVVQRWSDPAFPRAFSWFMTPRFWEDHMVALREQLDSVAEPALALD